MSYKLARIIFGFIYAIFFRLRIIGGENVPQQGAAIIASNHVSNLDPPTLGTACKARKIDFMAKIELFRNPVFAAIISKLGAFPVRRGTSDRAAIKTALERLRSGRVLGIFPEGTRSKNGALGKAEPGAIMLACKTGATIIPAAISGTEKISLSRPFPQITVIFGKPLPMPENLDEKDTPQQIADSLMQEIGSLLAQIRNDKH